MISFETLPFDEAIKFFRDKTVLTPDRYRQIGAEAQAKAFSLAGVARMDVLTDVYGAIDKAISQGTTFQDFKKDVRGIMAKRGWKGLNPYRLETIFRTSIQQAYQAGHYQRQRDLVKTRPYWQYVAVMDGRTRPAHRIMNGKVVRADDPFWSTNYPPNGFRCRCTVRSLSGSEMTREGLAVDRSPVNVADPGFTSNPGASMGHRLTDDQFAALKGDPERWAPLIQRTFESYKRPSARNVTDYSHSTATLWPKGQKAVDLYKTSLLGKVFEDPLHDPLVLNEPFINHLQLDGRERLLPLIEEMVRNPYEIWLQAEKERVTGKIVLRKRYVSLMRSGKGRPLLLVAESASGQWTSYTYVYSSDSKYLDGVRN
ncbi:MAG: minor capsid protein, partial [Syntrophorhabdus aromaticivorans]|nr:minor capsid protein [Syntrophorhabdus aromaticivorans]